MLIYLQLSIITILISSIIPLAFTKHHNFARIASAIFLIISGGCAIFSGCNGILLHNEIVYQLPAFFPYFSLQFALDPLSGFFLSIVGIIAICAGIYSIGYLKHNEDNEYVRRVIFFTGIFIASMYLTLLAHDVFSFMLAWESMSISSYFLVLANNKEAKNRHAAFLYLIMAHISGLLILFAYCVLVKFSGNFSFDAIHSLPLSQSWATFAFLLAFAGFGMKAGLLPFHVWLPEAHPAAPSHISALMSGVMLKIAIYGFIRFAFYLLGDIEWQWGMVVLIIGSASAIFGILYALTQNNLKKLLAYSSIDNIGIIFLSLGLSMIFINAGHTVLGALGLIAALYHILNHAIFKSLLFFGAGAILHQTHEDNLENMGGMIHKMPLTALLFLVGSISISALPPFNGFVSEWLVFQTALQSTSLSSGILRSIVPITASLLALTSVLVGVVFVKTYGIGFLGQPRSQNVKSHKDPKFSMLFGMGILALLCLLLGIFPTFIISVLNVIPKYLINSEIIANNNWLWLVPINTSISSYSAPIILFALLLTVLVLCVFLRICKSKYRTIAKPWECGFGKINYRMQYSATAFAMPLRRVFSGAWQIKELIEKNAKIFYKLEINDWLLRYVYEPCGNIMTSLTKKLALIQGGNIRIYLIYIFITLLVLLWIVA